MVKIHQYTFQSETSRDIKLIRHGQNWPIVYILNNHKEVYIGESANFLRRFKEHMRNTKRAELTKINIIDDDRFNKSAILDIESELIRLMDADQKYKLQNIVLGQNQAHDYYQRSEYKKMMNDIWNHLRNVGLANHDFHILQNTDLFIFSPYKTLTTDQYDCAKDILYELGESLLCKKPSIMRVHGMAGTGKSILAVYLLKVLTELKAKQLEMAQLEELEDDGKYEEGTVDGLLQAFTMQNYKIGMVVPITSFRDTLKKVFRQVDGLQAKLLITPSDVVNAYQKGEPYDILLIDEAQRLKRPVNIQNLGTFYEKNRQLGFEKTNTELDWILKCSKHQIFFYDNLQSVSGSDIPVADLNKLNYEHQFSLNTQMRIKGGKEYMQYIRDILSDTAPSERLDLQEYEVKIFDDVQAMCDEIKAKNDIFGLCRNIAGFAWPWSTKHKEKGATYDIEIQGSRFVWNNNNSAWIAQENSINEIGSIHTMQGQDLNYAGLIIGNDLSYDVHTKKIVVNKQHVCDVNAKRSLSDKEIRENIVNAYYILLSRARCGVYLYICDKHLKAYMKQFFS